MGPKNIPSAADSEETESVLGKYPHIIQFYHTKCEILNKRNCLFYRIKYLKLKCNYLFAFSEIESPKKSVEVL